MASGKAARAAVPLESHAVLAPTELRADPVELLERQAASRVPELVPIRYGRMLVSAVHVLPGGRAGDGLRPCRHTDLGAAGADLR